MNLQPVYLLAPSQERGTTRRAFVGACLTSTLAGALGGYFLGALTRRESTRSSEGTPGVAVDVFPEDPRVAWARGLAQGPMRVLWLNWDGYLQVLMTRAPDDFELWLGVRDISRAVIDGSVAHPDVDRRLVARALASFLSKRRSPPGLGLESLVASLQQIGRGR